MSGSLAHDLRVSVRALRKSPGFVAVAVLSLALGIGANTTIFTAVDVFLLRPLPYPDPEQLVQIWTTNPERGWTEASSAIPDMLDWREQSRSADIASYYSASFNASSDDRPERLRGVRVSANLLDVLGLAPALGRVPRAEEEAAGAGRVALISTGLWHRMFSADPAVIGRVLTLDGVSHEVIGVLPAGLKFPDPAVEVWVPLGLDGRESRDSRFISVVGRIRGGAELEAAQGELSSIADRLAEVYPASNRGMSVRLVPLHRQLYDATFRQATMMVTLAVGFVLLIACANVANLMLSRAAAREREMAVRAALGAGRGRLVRQVLVEALVIALAGGGLGALLAVWGVDGMRSLIPSWFPRADEIALDARSLAYAMGISLFAALVVGLFPALRVSRPDLRASLTEGARGATGGVRGGRVRSVLVVSEVALALALLVSAGLLIRSFIYLRTVSLGYQTAGVVTARLTLPTASYPDSATVVRFHRELLERLRGLPAVTAVGATTILPSDGGSGSYYAVVGQPPPPEGQRPIVGFRGVAPRYFETMGIPLVAGRAFTERDDLSAPPVVLINQALARRHWPDGDPVGERLEFASGVREIVGIVGDTRDNGPDDPPFPIAFVPTLQRGYRSLSLVLRTEADPGTAITAVRRELEAMDADLPLYDVRGMAQVVKDDVSGDTVLVKFLAIFAGMAFVLALIGVYGVMAYAVSQRTHEMGIRMALGAGRRDIVRVVLGRGLALAGMGAGIGLVLAFGMSHGLSAFLFGVGNVDPATFGGVTIALLLTAAAACYLPAQRATRVDPMVVLRYE